MAIRKVANCPTEADHSVMKIERIGHEFFLDYWIGDGWKNIGVYRSYDEALKEKEKRFFAVMHASQTEPQSTTDHISGPECWCEPELYYKDPETGAEVWVHRSMQ